MNARGIFHAVWKIPRVHYPPTVVFTEIDMFPPGTRLALAGRGGIMTVHDFIHHHYSSAVGESPTGHAIAILAGLALIAIGGGLIASVVFLPAGIAIGILGVLLVGAGVFAHIMSPLTFADLMDATVGLSGAAITLTFAVAIFAVVAGFTLTIAVSLFQWLVG